MVHPSSLPFNQHSPSAFTKEDFQVNGIKWEENTKSPSFHGTNKPVWVIDSTTGRNFLNEDRGLVREKCAVAFLSIPIASIAAALFNIPYRSVKVFSGYHFWSDKTSEKIYTFTAQIGDKTYQLKARFDDLHVVNKLLEADNEAPNKTYKVESEHVNFFDDRKIIKLEISNFGGALTTFDAEIMDTADDLFNNQNTSSQHIQHTAHSNPVLGDNSSKTIKLSNLKINSEKYDFKGRCLEVAKDVARLTASFFVMLPLLYASFLGLFKPYEGRKLISSIALAVLGTYDPVACLAPEASRHISGNSVFENNVW